VRELLADLGNGRDEMNLVELPIFLLSTRAPAGLNELEFEVEDFDRKLKQVVRRSVVVTGSGKYGLRKCGWLSCITLGPTTILLTPWSISLAESF